MSASIREIDNTGVMQSQWIKKIGTGSQLEPVSKVFTVSKHEQIIELICISIFKNTFGR